MKDILDHKVSQKWFWIFATVYMLAWTLMPTFLRGNIPFDTAEGIAWGNVWALGYDKHPFLAPWLSAGFTDFFGVTGWPVYWLSQLSVMICFWAVWRLAHYFLPPIQALISVLVLSGLYYYNIASTQFNPNILMLSTWALTSLCFYRACLYQRYRGWIFTGIFAGLAMLTKYESLLLLVPMFIFTVMHPQARICYRKRAFYLGVICFLLVILPNFIWLIQHNFLPFVYTEARLETDAATGTREILNHIIHPIYFLLEQFGALIPVFLLLSPFFFLPRKKQVVPSFQCTFLWCVGAGPFLLTLLYSVITGAWLHSLWAFPLFSFVGIIFLVWYQPILNQKRLKTFAWLIAIFCCLVIVARGTFLVAQPYFSKKGTSALFPGQLLSAKLTRVWQANYNTKLRYVAGKRTYVSNVAAYSKDHPIPYFTWALDKSPWMKNEVELRKQGAIFVWANAGNGSISSLPKDIATRFPKAKPLPVVVLPHLTHSKRLGDFRIGVAILPPSNECHRLRKSDN